MLEEGGLQGMELLFLCEALDGHDLLEVLAGEENSKPAAASGASRESIVSTRP
jgi:hypothetical protein